MDEMRSLIYECIEISREKEAKRHDKYEVAAKFGDVPTLYEMTLFYQSTIKDLTIIESMLKKALSSKFFKKANTEVSDNKIKFSNDEYCVAFPLSGPRVIEIIGLGLEAPESIDYINQSWDEELAELADRFLADKSKDNLNELSNHYFKEQGEPKGFIDKWFRNFKMYRKFNSRGVEDLHTQIESNAKLIRDNQAAVNKYGVIMAKTIEFAYSLTELADWQFAGWRIVHIDYKRAGVSKDLDYQGVKGD